MKLIDVREISVRMEGNVANALVNFSEHDISLVALVSDVIRDGKSVIGYAFDSIGRYAQGGILRDRMIPRLKQAEPESLLDASGRRFDAAKVLQTVLRNEKPGGHGDRAAAAGALELAVWDLNAKLDDEPAHVGIARHHGRQGRTQGVDVYAAGGYYYPDEGASDGAARLRDELQRYRDQGFQAFKMKIGGAPLATDLKRIEAALAVAGDGSRLSVDVNGRYDLDAALACARAIEPYRLRWYEEVGDPLDYGLNRRLTDAYALPVATGENLFSLQDVNNLVLFGGMLTGGELLSNIGWSNVMIAALVLLVIRPAIGYLALIDIDRPPLERFVIAFFGIRGLGSVYYLAFGLNHGNFENQDVLWETLGLIVLGSIVLHGLTVTPVMRLLNRRIGKPVD